MKYVLFALFFLVSFSNAVKINELITDINIDDYSSAEFFVTFKYDENVEKSDYFTLSKIGSVEVRVNDEIIECSVRENFGTSIICDDINTSEITYNFKSFNSVENLQNLNLFNYRISVTQLTDKFYLTVKLPVGSSLAAISKLNGTGLKQYEPVWGVKGSDGRKIYVQWFSDKPMLGETFDIKLIYENMSSTNSNILLILIVGFIVIAGFFIFRKQDVKDVTVVLTKTEKKIIEILLKENELDQRKIVKELDYSKSKITRILQNLKERNLIEITRKGRNNIIKLKKISKNNFVYKIKNYLHERTK